MLLIEAVTAVSVEAPCDLHCWVSKLMGLSFIGLQQQCLLEVEERMHCKP